MKTKASKAGTALANRRWEGKTQEEKTATASHAASQPRTDKRCFCGERSMWKAANRYFDCCRRAGVVELHLDRLRDGLHLRMEVKEDGGDSQGA